jgi:hypothetical protein
MPYGTSSKKQRQLMLAVAHSQKFANRVGIPMKVGKEFVKEDQARGLVKKHRKKK